jgi:hypothetical protein
MGNILARKEKKQSTNFRQMPPSKWYLSPLHAAALGKWNSCPFPSTRILCPNVLTQVIRLDLTAASVAYLLEPQWNPMMEEQALCRIHRLGQTKEVKTIRYRMRGSFEQVRPLTWLTRRSDWQFQQKVVAIQDLKKQIAADAFATEVRRSPLDSTKQLEVGLESFWINRLDQR